MDSGYFGRVMAAQLVPLDKIAKGIAERNEFGKFRLTPYEIKDVRGLVMSFKRGTLVLNQDLYWSFFGLPTMHLDNVKGVIEGVKLDYKASGEIDNNEISLHATQDIFRKCKRLPGASSYDGDLHSLIKEPRKLVFELLMRYRPYGDIQKTSERHDDSNLWFIIRGRRN